MAVLKAAEAIRLLEEAEPGDFLIGTAYNCTYIWRRNADGLWTDLGLSIDDWPTAQVAAFLTGDTPSIRIWWIS